MLKSINSNRSTFLYTLHLMMAVMAKTPRQKILKTEYFYNKLFVVYDRDCPLTL